MESHRRVGIGKLALWIALFVLLGTPLVAFLWETLNRVMAGWFDPVRIAISLPLLLLFYLLLRFLARVVVQLDAQRTD